MNVSSRNKTGCYNNTSFRCIDKSCQFCTQTFPEERHLKCTVKVTENNFGYGVFADCNIEPGDIICQYLGRKVRKSKGNHVAMLVEGWYINAEKRKCSARYINHSCDGNCTLKQITMIKKPDRTRSSNKREWTTDDEAAITELWVVAKKRIQTSEEITFHYGDDFKSFFPDRVCKCSNCTSGQGLRQLRKSKRLL